uniref:Uncharacterized protein n=1 Tax=Anguilla anguilla TaxID=7936 RepID=A0A0E9PQK2_ANGAN
MFLLRGSEVISHRNDMILKKDICKFGKVVQLMNV